MDVKAWVAEVPDVEAVRPAVCPCCGRPGRPAGERLGIAGHVLRDRQQRGPMVAGGAPGLVVVRVRRYACLSVSTTLQSYAKAGAGASARQQKVLTVLEGGKQARENAA